MGNGVRDGMRIRGGTVGMLLTVFFAAVLLFSGCAEAGGRVAASGEGDSADSGQTEAGGEEERMVVNQNFSHTEFVDNIAFILPVSWTHDSYEKIQAGDGMDSYEWGIHAYINGEEALKVTVCAMREAVGCDWPDGAEFTTGGGITGRKYRKPVGEDQIQRVCIVYDFGEASYAEYRVEYELPAEEYERYEQALDELALSLNVVSVSRQEYGSSS